MYQQDKNNFPSLRTSIPPERHFFQQGTNSTGDAGLVLSTDAKPRLKWTSELHGRFVEAVNQLGGAEKATPKTVMKLMRIPGLTLYHLKSHLQKYRLSKNLHGQANVGNSKNGYTAVADRMFEGKGEFMSYTNNVSQTSKSLQISEALQMQIEVQRKLHEQLEVQRHLQLRIEAQGKYLQSVLEKAEETLGRQNPGTSAGLETKTVQMPELVSRRSNECFNPTFLEYKSMLALCSQQPQTKQIADCSMDSCLTSCDGSQKEQEIPNFDVELQNYNSCTAFAPKETGDSRPWEIEFAWCGDLNESKAFPSEIIAFSRNSSNVFMMTGVQGENRSSSNMSKTIKEERDTKEAEQSETIAENKRPSEELSLSYLTGQLDLNAHNESFNEPNGKQFDLNGLSWN